MKDYYLMKGGLYYRPNAMGYTTTSDDAGVFTEVYAKVEEERTHGEVKAVPIHSKEARMLGIIERLKVFREKLRIVDKEYPNTPVYGLVVEFDADFPEVLK